MEAMMILVPEAYRGQPAMENRQEVLDFYKYWEANQEAWDGPALLVWSDGKKVRVTSPAYLYMSDGKKVIVIVMPTCKWVLKHMSLCSAPPLGTRAYGIVLCTTVTHCTPWS